MARRAKNEAYWDRDHWWPAIREALENVLGPPDRNEFHGLIPFEFGPPMGCPDMMKFHSHVDGVAYTTCELIGRDDRPRNDLGDHELMICLPRKVKHNWATDTLCGLAYYTMETPIQPGETCDIGDVPKGSKIAALLFSDYARFKVHRRKAGLLLAIGITGSELEYVQKRRPAASLVKKLKEAGAWPVTVFGRKPVV
jgi:hypothetical protein